MKLSKLKLRAFRCYRNEQSFDFETTLTAFIGKNDVGKSTVMDALEVFLSAGSCDKHDATKGEDGKNLTITCEFTDLPSDPVIDDTNATTFQAEHLLNADGRLEIQKVYSGHTASPKCTHIFAFAMHPSVPKGDDLLQLTNANLKKRAKELGVDLNGVDRRSMLSCVRVFGVHFQTCFSSPRLCH